MKEFNLKDEQLYALRFAADDELSDMVNTAADENLGSDAIKKSIKTWKGDHRRV